MRFTLNGSTVTPGHAGSIPPADPGRPDIVATVGQLAKIKTYASPGLATAGSYCSGACTGSPPQGITAISVFYSSATAVSMVGMRLNGTPSACPNLFPAFVNDPRCYVGRDSDDVVGWAVFGDMNLTSYSTLFAMPQVSNTDDTTKVYLPADHDRSHAAGRFVRVGRTQHPDHRDQPRRL